MDPLSDNSRREFLLQSAAVCTGAVLGGSRALFAQTPAAYGQPWGPDRSATHVPTLCGITSDVALFEFNESSIAALKRTSFESFGVHERPHLQKLLQESISVIDPDIFVITEEFGEWQDAKRRIDLLCLDRDANLVVVELKRTEDGGHMDLQALRYAAMVSTLTFEKLVEAHAQYLTKYGRPQDAGKCIVEFLGWQEEEVEHTLGDDVRIILVAAEFSKEITTTVLWLNERDLDIRCIRLHPYEWESRLILDVQQMPAEHAVDPQRHFRLGKLAAHATRLPAASPNLAGAPPLSDLRRTRSARLRNRSGFHLYTLSGLVPEGAIHVQDPGTAAGVRVQRGHQSAWHSPYCLAPSGTRGGIIARNSISAMEDALGRSQAGIGRDCGRYGPALSRCQSRQHVPSTGRPVRSQPERERPPDHYVSSLLAGIDRFGGARRCEGGRWKAPPPNRTFEDPPRRLRNASHERQQGAIYNRLLGPRTVRRGPVPRGASDRTSVDPRKETLEVSLELSSRKSDQRCYVYLLGPQGALDKLLTEVSADAAKPPGLPQILAFSANPPRVPSGGSVRISWNVANANSVNLSGLPKNSKAGGAVGPSGTLTINPTGTNTALTLRLEATSDAGAAHREIQVLVDPSGVKPQIVSFSAEPNQIQAGGKVTLRWQVIGAQQVELSTLLKSEAIMTGIKKFEASASFETTLQTTTRFQLTIAGVSNPDTKQLTVLVDPKQVVGEHSPMGTAPVTVRFDNATTSPVEVFWVDYDGKEKGYGTIAPGSSLPMDTSVGHIWHFRQKGQMVRTFAAPNAAAGQSYTIQNPVPITKGGPIEQICIQGYVWREASPTDHVCVTPAVRSQALKDNSQSSARKAGSGDYGPDTCKQGYVWRDAFPGDHVCVEPAVRDQAASGNSQAPSRENFMRP